MFESLTLMLEFLESIYIFRFQKNFLAGSPKHLENRVTYEEANSSFVTKLFVAISYGDAEGLRYFSRLIASAIALNRFEGRKVVVVQVNWIVNKRLWRTQLSLWFFAVAAKWFKDCL